MLAGVCLKGKIPKALCLKHLSNSEQLEVIVALQLLITLPHRLSHIKERGVFGSWECGWAVG